VKRPARKWLRSSSDALLAKTRWFDRKDALFLFAQLASFVASLGLVVLLTRFLSPHDYVDYALVSAGIGFLVPLSSAGLAPFVIRQYRNAANRPYDLRFAVSATFLVSTGLTLLLIAIGWLLGLVVRPPAEMAAVALLIPLTGLLIVANGLYRAERRAGDFFMAGSGQRLILLGVLLALFLLVPTLRTVLGYLLSAMAAAMITLAVLRLRVFPSAEAGKTRDLQSVRLALAFSVPMALANCVSMAQPFFERILIKNTFEAVAVGQYVFNSDIAVKSLAMASLAIKLIVFPKITTGKPEQERRLFMKMVRISLIAAVPAYAVFLIGTFLYQDIFRFMLGSELYLNVAIFRILGVYSVLVVLGYIFQIGLILNGKTYYSLTATALSTLVHLAIINSIGTRFGIEGVAISIVIAQSLAVALMLWASTSRAAASASFKEILS